MSITFREILNQKSWTSYEDYVAEGINQYSSELSKDISEGRKHKKAIREFDNAIYICSINGVVTIIPHNNG
jgi:hypothetical protein